MIFFTSDTHYGSMRTLDFSKRPFATVHEMDEAMKDNYCSVVTPNDTVYHLGDVGKLETFSSLPGKKFLLLGNYDVNEYIPSNITVLPQRYVRYESRDLTCTLIHEPDTIKKCGDHIEDDFYLFGHIHKLQMIKRNGLNVGVDCHNFTPVDIPTILFYRNAILNHYDDNVFMEKI